MDISDSTEAKNEHYNHWNDNDKCFPDYSFDVHKYLEMILNNDLS
jgi:hypothetical protein